MSLLSGLGTAATTAGISSSAVASSAGLNANGTTSTAAAQAQASSEYNQFLTILTTELQNQDPTSPLDTNQFTSQLVSFSSLEQQLNTNTNLQTLIANQSGSSGIGSALGYIGHTVTAPGNSFTTTTAGASSTLNYSLASGAASATINVINSAGNTVDQFTGSVNSGANSVTFNGQDASGAALPAGTYTFKVQAVDANGNAVTATTSLTGVVTGVETTNGTTMLDVGGTSINASTVTQVTS